MKGVTIIGASLALLLFSAVGSATPIQANYTVNANGTDPGLRVQTAEVADNPFSFNLTEGSSNTFKLFNIWTDEASVNDDDTVTKPISVEFGFTLPDIFDGTINGGTAGTGDRQDIFGYIFYTDQNAVLSWNNSGSADFSFGPNSDGLLRVSLSNADFNTCFPGLSLCGGDDWWAVGTVYATVTLVHDATAAVPEPGTLALFGIGLLGFAVTARRTRRRI